MAAHRLFELGSQHASVARGSSNRRVVAPARLMVTQRLRLTAPPVGARWKLLRVAAYRREGLHLRRDEQISMLVVAEVERDDADRIARDQPFCAFAIPQHEGEHSI